MAGIAAAAALALPCGAHAATFTGPLGLSCDPDSHPGMTLCTGILPTWDGTGELDSNLALPAGQSSNLPVVVLMHGWGGSKQTGDGIDSNLKPWTDRGYAVLNYSARGFAGSCGAPLRALQDPPNCLQGWIHLADVRFEVRDTQEILGKLADAGTIDGQRIGVTGPSYAGGQSLDLAALKDRVMNTDGSLKPWESPNHKPMRIAAGAPNIPWTDLVYSLQPNGRTLDYTITPDDPNGVTKSLVSDLNPFGILKRSFVSGLYARGQQTGYIAAPGVDSQADLSSWYARVTVGEPADDSSNALLTQLALYHSPYYIDHSEPPAPLFIANGFTDDLFPPDEAIRFYNRTREQYPDTPISLMFFDEGHQRGANKAADVDLYKQRVYDWFAYYVKGDQSVTPLSGVETLTQTCPASAPSGGPYFAPSWAAIHPGEVRLLSSPAQTVMSTGGDPSVSATVDPIAAGQDPCGSTGAADQPGSATYRLPAAPAPGYTLMGSPTVIANLTVDSGPNPEVAARLWDVAPDGQSQTLVARGLYRPNPSGLQVFQLHPNGWHFAAGHVPKVELLGQDEPYGRAANGPFQITVQNMDLRLPVAEEPGSPGVGVPGAPVLAAGSRLAPGVVSLGLKVKYRKAKKARRAGSARKRRAACSWSSVGVRVTGTGLGQLKKVQFMVGKRTLARRSRGPFVANIKSSKLRKQKNRSHALRVRARVKDGSLRTLRKTLRACRPAKRR